MHLPNPQAQQPRNDQLDTESFDERWWPERCHDWLQAAWSGTRGRWGAAGYNNGACTNALAPRSIACTWGCRTGGPLDCGTQQGFPDDPQSGRITRMTSAGPVPQPRRAFPATPTSLTGSPDIVMSMVLFLLRFSDVQHICVVLPLWISYNWGQMSRCCQDFSVTHWHWDVWLMHCCVQRKDCSSWACKLHGCNFSIFLRLLWLPIFCFLSGTLHIVVRYIWCRIMRRFDMRYKVPEMYIGCPVR